MNNDKELELNQEQQPVDVKQQTTPNVVELKKRKWIPYVITTAVVAVLVVLMAWVRGVFSEIDPQKLAALNETETQYRIKLLCDAFSIPGVLAICFGLLVIVSNGGAFDMLAYSMRAFFRLFKKDPLDRKYGSYYDYQQARKEKKRSFWYFIIVGGAYLLVGIVLLIVYMQM